MPIKHKNRYEGGSMRVQNLCPCCGAPCVVRGSVIITNRTRRSVLHCTAPLCGWQGLALTEITHTTAAPSELFRSADMPPFTPKALLLSMQEALAESPKPGASTATAAIT